MKEKTVKIEEMFLSPYAKQSKDTIGRLREETPCSMRTEFQRDRDKIIHSKSFRRLKNKTQVFISPEGDHYRTRLTHTLNVSQIARSIARALSLNEDLTEAIALGHDLGHTPFGHSGERILSKLNPNGFRHNEQSGRVVKYLESDGKGLNLTGEVVDGIINHKCSCSPMTLEAKAVSFADRIAYINHDIEDAIVAGFIIMEDLPKEAIRILGSTSGKRINTMVYSIYQESMGKNIVAMGKEIWEATNALREFMFERVYFDKIILREEEKAELMLTALYNHYKKHPELLPEFYISLLDKFDKETVLCDYISSMSDGYVIKTFEENFIPKTWKL